MGIKLPADQLHLYEGIDEILWNDWDPIGVSDIPEARDEYRTYLPQVFQLALNNAAPLRIAEYLHEVVACRMELSSTVDQHLRVAAKIRDLKLRVMPESV